MRRRNSLKIETLKWIASPNACEAFLQRSILQGRGSLFLDRTRCSSAKHRAGLCGVVSRWRDDKAPHRGPQACSTLSSLRRSLRLLDRGFSSLHVVGAGEGPFRHPRWSEENVCGTRRGGSTDSPTRNCTRCSPT